MNQCDIEEYDQSELVHSASLDSESSDSNESPLLFCTSSSPSSSSSFSLSSSPLSSAGPGTGRCVGRADCDHPPAPSHVRVARGGVSRTGGTLDMPSSWRGGSVGVGYQHLDGDG